MMQVWMSHAKCPWHDSGADSCLQPDVTPDSRLFFSFFFRYVISCYFRGTLFEHLIVCNQDGKSTINHRHFGTFATIDQVTPSPSTQPSNVGDAIATDPHSPPSTSSSPTHPSVSVDPPSILTSLVCAVRSCTCTCICCCSVH